MTTLPTLYEYYTSGGVTAGLSADQPHFTLNNKNITIYSGALHYFRVPQEYWRDRLRKMRAAGLNAVETYVPWNLHEPQPGVYDFGNGVSDYQELLDVEKFLKIAQEEDLLAIVRPGPYICAEWEFGGLPSWLLREKGIQVRTSDQVFMGYVQKYFMMLLSILSVLQFSKGGPIIAFQIENEYGYTMGGSPTDKGYLRALKKIFEDNGIVELLFTSDTPSIVGTGGWIEEVLYTANLKDNAKRELERMQVYQSGKPSFVMEFWTGWFDHWTEEHNTRTAEDFLQVYKEILDFPASVNMYMFHGGSNWAFMNGGNLSPLGIDNRSFKPTTSSYDYDAPLSEAGDYTDKYFAVKAILEEYNKIKTRLPPLPALTNRTAYPAVQITHQIGYESLIQQVTEVVLSPKLLSMEQLPIHNNSGQSYGYIVYRKEGLDIAADTTLTIENYVSDTVMVLINGKLVSKITLNKDDMKEFGYWKKRNSALNLGPENYRNATLDLVVENFGRVNAGRLSQFNQFKGIWKGNVTLNQEVVTDWKIIPLEFKKNWLANLKGWEEARFDNGPTLYKGYLDVKERRDTFVDFRGWYKGILFVNGFALSKYFHVGPQKTAYLPAPFLKEGRNEFILFEQFVPKHSLGFVRDQFFETYP